MPRVPSRTSVPLNWLVTRGLMALMAWAYEWYAGSSDLFYLFGRSRPGETLTEYPDQSAWFLRIPSLITSDEVVWVALLVALFLTVDAVATALVGRTSRDVALAWLWLTCAFGPLTFMRLDLLPSLCVLLALTWAVARPAVAGALLGFGTMLKFWPVAVTASLFGLGRRTLRAAAAFLGVVLACLAITAATSGIDRILSPLAWQGGRGLMVDSVWATVPMLRRAFDDSIYTVAVSRYAAFEITGPGVATWLVVAEVTTVLALVVVGLLGALAWWRGERRPAVVALVATASVALVLATNKTLSPQFALWLIAAGAVAVGFLSGRRRVLIALWIATIAVLTHLTYPVFAGMLTTAGPGTKRLLSTLVLASRNLALLVGAVVIAYDAARLMLGRQLVSSASSNQASHS